MSRARQVRVPVELARIVEDAASQRSASVSGWLREVVRSYVRGVAHLHCDSDDSRWISYREDDLLRRQVEDCARSSGATCSEIVRAAIRRSLSVGTSGPARTIDETGARYGRLIVLERVIGPIDSDVPGAHWRCACDCGG